MMKIINQIFNLAVKENFLLHLLMAYFLCTFLSVYVVFGLIIIKELIDKYIIKTKFSWLDVLAGVIGIGIYFLMFWLQK